MRESGNDERKDKEKSTLKLTRTILLCSYVSVLRKTLTKTNKQQRAHENANEHKAQSVRENYWKKKNVSENRRAREREAQL